MSGTGEGGGENKSNAARNTIAAGAGCGCLFSPVVLGGAAIVVIIICGFGVLLAPLIALILLFGGGGGGGDSTNEETANESLTILQGDGKGELDVSTVPTDLAEHIKKAGELCSAIGPIVIASQIEKESGFDASLVGAHGEKGVSQLPPDIFEKYGKDDDDNDKTSATDAADSIMAQGRYLCELADQAQKMIDSGEVKKTDAEGNPTSVLDLALAGYHVGIDEVRKAKGMPQTNDAQGYVFSIRVQFAKYQGIGAPPSGATPGVTPSVPESLKPEPGGADKDAV
ncbi:lytic transglycosylase domain-containing protein [Streptomyces sp. NPDC058001]|uniref:lytic transglycosylase domain-containing protein n=1 Tax=Streptomyces sp. NPDC058001 TaxID=3346300 RepID=UPI0036E06A22